MRRVGYRDVLLLTSNELARSSVRYFTKFYSNTNDFSIVMKGEKRDRGLSVVVSATRMTGAIHKINDAQTKLMRKKGSVGDYRDD